MLSHLLSLTTVKASSDLAGCDEIFGLSEVKVSQKEIQYHALALRLRRGRDENEPGSRHFVPRTRRQILRCLNGSTSVHLCLKHSSDKDNVQTRHNGQHHKRTLICDGISHFTQSQVLLLSKHDSYHETSFRVYMPLESSCLECRNS